MTLWRSGLVSLTLLVFAFEVVLLSPRAAHANPATTISRYTGGSGASTVTDFYTLGCNRAAGPTGTVVLAFGGPVWDSTLFWGVDPPGFASFWTVGQVEARAKEFARGVYECRTASTSIAVVIGTSNDHFASGVTSGNGIAWATMVKAVQSYITAWPSWSPWVNAYGGNDVEPSFSTSTQMRNWYSGYGSVSSARRVYNFGSADACPQSYALSGGAYVSGQTATAGGCLNGWTQDDVYHASWGHLLAWNIPEIYTNYDSSGAFSAQAIQWERIVRYAKLRYSRTMLVSGVMVQYLACQEVGCDATLDNTATQGYDQLWAALQYVDGGSGAQTPNWLTDISWYQ